MLRAIALVACSLLISSLSAQDFLPDSLRQRFALMRKDSAYIDQLNAAAFEYLKTNPSVTRSIANYVITEAPKIQYTRGYARGLVVLGSSYWYEGIYEFAQNYYLLAARQYQGINDNVGLGQTYNNIGEVYKKLNEDEKALTYLLRALELKDNDSATIPITLYNIGELYVRMNRLKEGKEYIDRSLRAAQQQNNQRVIAFNYWALGEIERKDKDYNAALQYYFESERIWKALNEMRSLIQTYQEIAVVYSDARQFAQAESYIQRAISLASRMKVADLQVNNFLRYARIDSLRGNYERSLFYLHRYNTLKDSVYTLLKAEQIARLQTIYETELREQENKALRNEKQISDARLRTQYIAIGAITVGLLVAGVLAWFLYRQRKKISLQKEAIEMQAVALQKLNEDLQELNKNLEKRIEERTSQLTIQNQRLTEYTFINAHKLRAPVASILGLINLLQKVQPEEKEPILEHLKTCGDQLDTIIRDVSRNLEDAIVPDQEKSS